MIELTDVTKVFPGMEKPAVHCVSFSIGAGETVVLLGSSGCGKSTTLKLINRLLEPDSGAIRIGGEATSGQALPELRRSIGYVIQNVGLFPHWTVEENVGAKLRNAGVPRAERKKSVRELMDLVGMDPGKYRMDFMQVSDLGPELMYPAIARGDVDVIGAFSTDGRIIEFDLKPLADDREFFPPYEALPVARGEILRRYPPLEAALRELGGILGNKTMAALNHEVDVAKRNPRDVVRDFLRNHSPEKPTNK